MESCMWERVPQMYHLFEKEEINIIVNITVFWIVKPCSLVGIQVPAIWRNFLLPPSW